MALIASVILLCTIGAGLIEGAAIGKQYPGTHSRTGVHQFHPSLRIVNGNKTDIKDLPFLVSLKEYGDLWGSGVIVNERWIVTTGFNTIYRNPDEIQVRAGSSKWNAGGQILDVEAIYVHPNYTGLTWDYNIGLIKTSKKIRFGKKVQPVNLGNRTVKAGTTSTVAGWGIPTAEAEYASEYLLSTNLSVLANKTCAKVYGDLFTNNLMCTQISNFTGPCSGDFGDPLIVNKTVYGLYAGAMSCIPGSYPQVYTSIPALYDWIQSYVSNSTTLGTKDNIKML